jgi:pimeloyl-ACP methyl ester carboxylesterase
VAPEEETVILPGGLSAVERVPRASTSKPPVLLLHGMMGGAWQFRWLQEALSEAGYRSLALNYRGHHGSLPVRRLGRVGVDEYLYDALCGCAQLGEPPIAIGQSMGGLVAQLLAERGAVRAAVLAFSLPPAGIRWRGVRDPRNAWRHLPDTLRGRPLRPDRPELEDLILNRIPVSERAAFFSRQVPESSRAGAQIAFGLIRVSARAVTCPILSLGASEDRLVLPAVAEQIASRYSGEHLCFEGAGHYALVGEPGWRTRAATTIAWCDEVSCAVRERISGAAVAEGGLVGRA